MNSNSSRYYRHRFPPLIISHAVGLYHRFCLSFRDVEDLLAERGVIVSHETVRQWCQKFGLDNARDLRRRQGRRGDIWHLDELFVAVGHQAYPTVTTDGDLYFFSWDPVSEQEDIYISRTVNGVFSELQKLSSPVNSNHQEYDPLVLPGRQLPHSCVE